MEQFHVIVPYANPFHYQNRFNRQLEFEYNLDRRVQLHTVECSYNGEFDLCYGRANRIRVQASKPLWVKERLINLAIRQLPANAKFGWFDGDIEFQGDWIESVLAKLNDCDVIQPWSSCRDLNHDGLTLKTWASFCSGGEHPGYAWAARKSFIEDLGGLFDVSILGGGDRIMVDAFRGHVLAACPKISEGFVAAMLEWEVRAKKARLGFSPQIIQHHWHGSKANRGYKSRWHTLVDHEYSPADLVLNEWGVYELNKPALQADIEEYFLNRDEDGIIVPVNGSANTLTHGISGVHDTSRVPELDRPDWDFGHSWAAK